MRRTWAIGLFASILVLFLAGYNILLQRGKVLEEARTTAANFANNIELGIEKSFGHLDNTLTELEHFLLSHSSEQLDPPTIRSVIDNLVLETPYLSGLSVIDKEGQILYWNNNLQKINVSEREYFRAHLSAPPQGLFIGRPQTSLLYPDQWIFGVSRAVRHQDKSLSMVLAAIINLRTYSRQYLEMTFPPGTQLAITALDDQIYVLLPDSNARFGKKFLPSTTSSPGDEESNLVVTRQVATLPLKITVSRNKKSVLAPWYSMAYTFTFIGVAATLGLVYSMHRLTTKSNRWPSTENSHPAWSTPDPLTRLINRPSALERAQLEIKKAKRSTTPLSIVLLDLDHFKDVNRRYGHDCGDRVLKGTAALLRKLCRETDVISRIGGEKFLLLLPGTPLEGAVSDARKIRNRLTRTAYPHSSGEFTVTASFGVAEWLNDESDISEALRRAEVALVSVKVNGRNDVWWAGNRGGQSVDSDLDVLLHS